MKKIIIACSLLLFTMTLLAQNTESVDQKMVKVHLKDGSIISGELISWKYGEEVVITARGVTLNFPDDIVKKVVEEESFRIKPPIVHDDHGIFYTAKAQILAGNAGDRAHHRVGYGLTGSVGYRWNQFLSLGLGTGYRQFIWDTGEEMIPIFLEAKGFFGNQAVRPFYNLEMGYSFSWTNDDLNLTKAKGGVLVYPSFGISMGRPKLKYTADIGYLFQNAQYTYGGNFDDRVRSEQNITYQRLTLRLGVQF